MKKLFSIFCIVFLSTVNLLAQNTVITYKAAAKLTETTNVSTAGLHKNVFRNSSNTILSISNHAYDSSTKTGTITFNGVVTTIGEKAFAGCSGMTAITIPDEITKIENYAFSQTGLTSLTIPENVIYWGGEVLSACNSLTTLYWNAKDVDPSGYAGAKTSGTGANISKTLTTVVFGENVETIPASLFKNNNALASVTIPASVKSIGLCAFSGCTALTNISLPEGLTNIGVYAFYNSGLTSCVIPSTVTTIGDFAFENCRKLTSVVNSANLTSLGKQVFSGCTLLESIEIPDGVTTLGDFLFSGCKSLSPFTIPANVDSIGRYAFENCQSLTSLEIPEGVKRIGKKAFSGCTGLTSITIPESVEHMWEGNQFEGCTNLQSVVWNAKNVNASDWGSYSKSPFYNLSNIKSFTFGENVQSIPNYLCYYLSGLNSVTSLAVVPPTCQSYPFSSAAQSGKLYIPEGTKYAYHNKTYWKNFFKAVSFAETNSSINLTTYEDRYRDVTLTGRTIRTGGYNTLCLPFDMTAEDIAQSSLKDATIYRFVRATGNADDGLYINFAPTTSMEAGVPYIVTTETDIANPKFIASQIIENTGHSTMGDGTGNVEFVAHMYSEKLPAGDKSNLFFTAEGLTWSQEGDATTMPAFRAYFHVNDASAVARRCPARVVLHDEVATALEYTPSSMDKENLAGASKSIVNGQLVITRGEQQYTIQGQRIN